MVDTSMAMTDPRTPNLFIVGAPKSGTTAIAEHLRRHPDVAMSRPKEPHFFGRASTQDDGNRFFEKRVGRPHSTEAYLSLWDGCEDQTWRGEGSTWYLYLPGAAQEIKAFSPDARIIIALRDPVELVHALHSQWLNRSDNETIRSFRRAWRASAARAKGRRLPRDSFFPFGLDYRRAGQLAGPVRTYLDTFGRTRVLVLLLDDLRRDSDAFYRQVTDFLGLAPIPSKPDPVNANLRRRSRWLRWVLRSPPRWIAWPARVVPWRVRMRVARALTRWNSRKMPRPPLSPGMEQELREAFDDDVRALQQVIGRDLSDWRAKRDEA